MKTNTHTSSQYKKERKGQRERVIRTVASNYGLKEACPYSQGTTTAVEKRFPLHAFVRHSLFDLDDATDTIASHSLGNVDSGTDEGNESSNDGV